MPIDTSQRTAPLPEGFLGYLQGMGPGIVAVLTWFGAGDVVSAGVAGGNYGYALMWTMVVAVLMRYALVSLLAKYQLCNQYGEGVIDGLARLHRWFPPALFAATILMGHLAIWTLGAELIHRRGDPVGDLEGLTQLLGLTMGDAGRRLFLLGVFAAVFTSLVGVAMGLGFIGSHTFSRWRSGPGPTGHDYSSHRMYPFIVGWILISPLIWTHPALANFVVLTLVGNAIQVVILPVLAGGLWWITASRRFIGEGNQNRWWQNVVMAILFALSLWGSWEAIHSVYGTLHDLFAK